MKGATDFTDLHWFSLLTLDIPCSMLVLSAVEGFDILLLFAS